MKIVHICLACFYIDGMGYQENILPKYHAQNHEVFIITSDYSFDAKGTETKRSLREYTNEYGIPVKVLERNTQKKLLSRYKLFNGLYEALEQYAPDIIFCHGGQFVSLKDVVIYCKKHPTVKLFIDQHGDYYNTPVNSFRKRMGQSLIVGHWMRKAVPYTEKFWGVTPWRCTYLNDVYKIPQNKIDLLPMGGDDEKIHFKNRDEIRHAIRSKYNIAEDDLLLITGGKIDSAKQIDLLMEAIIRLNCDNVKLLVFGQPTDGMKEKIETLAQDSHIRFIGWIPADTVYDYFLASDLAVFPGTHSVLWEQACACGLPGIFRDWEGMHHVDVGGNALFLHRDSSEEMKEVLWNLVQNPEKLRFMKEVAETKGIPTFSYRRIAQKAILEDTKT